MRIFKLLFSSLGIFLSGFILLASLSFNVNAVVGQLNINAQQSDGVLVRFKSGVSNATRQQVLNAAGCAETQHKIQNLKHGHYVKSQNFQLFQSFNGFEV